MRAGRLPFSDPGRFVLRPLGPAGTLTVSNIDYTTMRAKTEIPVGDLFTVRGRRLGQRAVPARPAAATAS